MRSPPAVPRSALRAHLAERFGLISLGYYSSEDRVAHQILPTLTGDSAPIVTSIHESTHRDLAVSTDIGWFESLVGAVASHRATEPDLEDSTLSDRV